MNELYHDITWMMNKVDLNMLVTRMGWNIVIDNGTHLIGYCPDHKMFVGREASDPKWYIEKATGKTYCFTESRGSNILFTVARLKDISYKEAQYILYRHDITDFELKLLRLEQQLKKSPHKKEEELQNNNPVLNESYFKQATITERGYQFFQAPPNKPPTNINKETVDHFNVVEFFDGYYGDRVVIPCYVKGVYRGFVAIDIIGKEEWSKKHPDAPEGTYKKVLYPKGMATSTMLFNIDGVSSNAEKIVITEAPREVMKLWQEGYKDSVAILGSNLSNEQILLLSKKCPKRVMVMFDGDEAGKEATKKAVKKLDKFFDVYCVWLPEGADPKHLSRKDFCSLFRYASKIKV